MLTYPLVSKHDDGKSPICRQFSHYFSFMLPLVYICTCKYNNDIYILIKLYIYYYSTNNYIYILFCNFWNHIYGFFHCHVWLQKGTSWNCIPKAFVAWSYACKGRTFRMFSAQSAVTRTGSMVWRYSRPTCPKAKAKTGLSPLDGWWTLLSRNSARHSYNKAVGWIQYVDTSWMLTCSVHEI